MQPRALYERFDRFQRRHAWLAFPLAVRQKYSEDQGGYLAATITYYGFFSIFPLLLVLVTALGFVLRGHPQLEHTIIDSALGQFPVIGRQLRTHSLHGSGVALALGLVASLWSGMGVCLAAESAMNQLWGVPYRARPSFLRTRGRALLLLALLGGGVIGTTALAWIGTAGAAYGTLWKVGSIGLSTLLNFGLLWVAFRLLVTQQVSWRCLRGGAAAAAVGYEILQTVGGYYVGHTLRHAGSVYGTFGLVIGLLSWIYLATHVVLLAAEANVVATHRLWPRSFSVLLEQPSTDGDRRALRQRVLVEERRQDQAVETAVPSDADAPGGEGAREPDPVPRGRSPRRPGLG